MNVTRRGFVALVALALAGCSSGGSGAETPAADASRWHTVFVEGLSLEVPLDADIDKKTSTEGSYWISGETVFLNVMVEEGDAGVTGSYERREINGLDVYVSEEDPGTVKVVDGGTTYTLLIFAPKDGNDGAYKEARDHIIETLSR